MYLYSLIIIFWLVEVQFIKVKHSARKPFAIMKVYTYTKIDISVWLNKTKVGLYYPFPIDLAPNGLLFDAKSVGKG